MKKLTDIMLVKSDPIVNQSSIRAMQIIMSLRKRYSAMGLGWNRKSDPLANSEVSLQLLNLKAPYGFESFGPVRLALYFPIFWIWVFAKLCIHRPRVVHACDLATILPCFFYKILFKKKLVFDILDRYGMTYVPKKGNIFFRTLHPIVNSVEEFFAKKSDVLITVSDKMLLSFKRKPRNYAAIMNCPEELITPKKLKTDSNYFRILFTGAIRKGRGLEAICNIIDDINETQLLITGKIKDITLHSKINNTKNIKYLGFLDRKELLELEVNSDAMIALYDLKLQSQYEYGMANKVLEAMMCGLPIITNISHELINETKCGVIVEYDNIEQIRDSIISLRNNPDLRKFYGTNGYKAYLEKYNWRLMENRLYGIYENLLDEDINFDK